MSATAPGPGSGGSRPTAHTPVVLLRSAGPGDLEALRALDPAALTAAAARERAPGGPVCLVAVPPGSRRAAAGEAPVGYVVLTPGGLLGNDLVERVAVAPGWRRRGVGSALLAAALAAARTPYVAAVTAVGDGAGAALRTLLAAGGWVDGGTLSWPGASGATAVAVRAGPYRGGRAPRLVHHLALHSDWQDALAAGSYRGSTLGAALEDVGFVHCSFADQVAGVLDAIYAGVGERLLVLTIDRDRLAPPVLVEPVPGTGQSFPHVYGPIGVSAVTCVQDVPRDGAGRLQLPALPRAGGEGRSA